MKYIILLIFATSVYSQTYIDSLRKLKVVIISNTSKLDKNRFDTLYKNTLYKYNLIVNQSNYVHNINNVDKVCLNADIIIYVDGDEGDDKIYSPILDSIVNEYKKIGYTELKRSLGFRLNNISTTLKSKINPNALILYINNQYASGGNSKDYNSAKTAIVENYRLFNGETTFYVINRLGYESLNTSINNFFKYLIKDRLTFDEIFNKINKNIESKIIEYDSTRIIRITKKDINGFYNHSYIGKPKNSISNILRSSIR